MGGVLNDISLRLPFYVAGGLSLVNAAIASAFLIGPIVRRMGERRALLLGISLGALSSLVIAAAYTGALFYLSIPIASLGGLTTPSLMAIASRRASESEQGRLQGALGSLQGIAMMIAPLLLSEIVDARATRPSIV